MRLIGLPPSEVVGFIAADDRALSGEATSPGSGDDGSPGSG
jgi:hypothetical protein